MSASSDTEEASGDNFVIDNEKLITEIQYNGEVIWNKRKNGHSSKTELSAAWDKVIENIGLDPKNKLVRNRVRSRWTTLRGRFAAEIKKVPKLKSGSAPRNFKSKFQYFHRLLFLKDSLEPAKSTGTYTDLVEAAKEKEAAEARKKEEEAEKEKNKDSESERGSESEDEQEEEEEKATSNREKEQQEEKVEIVSDSGKEEAVTLDQQEEANYNMGENNKPKGKSTKKVDTGAKNNCTAKNHLDVPQDEDMLFFCSLHRAMARVSPAKSFGLRRRMMEMADDSMHKESVPEVIVIDDNDEAPVPPKKLQNGTKRQHNYPPVRVKKEKVEKDLDSGYKHAPPSDAWNHGGPAYYGMNQSLMGVRGQMDTQQLFQHPSQYMWGAPSQYFRTCVPQTAYPLLSYQPPLPPPASPQSTLVLKPPKDQASANFQSYQGAPLPPLAPPFYSEEYMHPPARASSNAQGYQDAYGNPIPQPSPQLSGNVALGSQSHDNNTRAESTLLARSTASANFQSSQGAPLPPLAPILYAEASMHYPVRASSTAQGYQYAYGNFIPQPLPRLSDNVASGYQWPSRVNSTAPSNFDPRSHPSGGYQLMPKPTPYRSSSTVTSNSLGFPNEPPSVSSSAPTSNASGDYKLTSTQAPSQPSSTAASDYKRAPSSVSSTEPSNLNATNHTSDGYQQMSESLTSKASSTITSGSLGFPNQPPAPTSSNTSVGYKLTSTKALFQSNDTVVSGYQPPPLYREMTSMEFHRQMMQPPPPANTLTTASYQVIPMPFTPRMRKTAPVVYQKASTSSPVYDETELP